MQSYVSHPKAQSYTSALIVSIPARAETSQSFCPLSTHSSSVSYARWASGARCALLNMPSGRTFPFESIIQAPNLFGFPRLCARTPKPHGPPFS